MSHPVKKLRFTYATTKASLQIGTFNASDFYIQNSKPLVKFVVEQSSRFVLLETLFSKDMGHKGTP